MPHIASSTQNKRAHTEKDLDHYFKEGAHNYHTQTLKTHQAWIRKVGVGDSILDVGSGSGLLLKEMLKKPSVARVLAIDISEAALRKGREVIRDTRVRFENRSIYSPLEGLAGTFDTAFMRFALHHFEFAQTALNNTAGALKKGGKLIVQDVLGYEDDSVDGLFARITRIRQPADFKFYSRPELASMLDRAGMKVTLFRSRLFKLDLKRWLAEYDQPSRVLAMFERAPAEARTAFHYHKVGDDRSVGFRTYMLVGTKA